MAQTTWKLVVTSLQADGEAREAVVGADNWLSALRLARKGLGEDGGVPPGASCVMSANGEVTILDAAQRRRYVLTRGGSSASIQPVAAATAPAPAPAAVAPAPAPAPAAAPAAAKPAGQPVRKSTMAYSPEESAAARAQLLAAAPQTMPAPSAPAAAPAKPVEPSAPAKAPAPEPAKPAATASVAPAAKGKVNTLAYSPAEAAAMRAQVAAAAGQAPAAPASPVGPAAIGARAPSGLQQPVQPAAAADKLGAGALRKGTLEYAPEDAAAARAQLLAAQQQAAALAETDPPPAGFSVGSPVIPRAPLSPAVTPPAAGTAPAPATSAPAATAPQAAAAAPAPGKAARKSTMAYSPEESANIRAQLMAAQSATAPAQPAPQPSAPVKPAAPAPAAAPAAPAPAAAAPAAQASAAAATPRKSTMAYSPEESANIRAQLMAAQQQQQGAPAAAPAASMQRRSATVAYIESPFVGGALLQLTSRSEEPSPEAPLIYRERTYFAHEQVDRARLESLLRSELEKITAELAGRARGQFVSLAVFDHSYEGKPQRPPIATLQWKDWRGAPVYWQGSQHSAPPMIGADEPIRTSFMPGPGSSPALAPAPAQSLQIPDARPAPASPLYTPQARRPGGDQREATGEQDRRLALAFEAVQDLYFLGTSAEGLEFAVKLLSELVPCEAVAGFIYDINTDEFRCIAATGPSATERRAEAIPSNLGLLAAAMRSGQDSFLVPSAASDARFDAAIDGRLGITTNSVAYLPLHKGEVWLGVLQLINREGSAKAFTEGDIAVAGYLASQVLEFLQQRRTVAPRRR